MRYWQPSVAKTTATGGLLHSENERQQSVNNVWSCILGNQGIAQIFKHLTEQSTALIHEHTIYRRRITHSKLIDIANCNTCKNKLLAVEYMILIRYYYQTATSAIYESIHGPAGQPANNLRISEG